MALQPVESAQVRAAAGVEKPALVKGLKLNAEQKTMLDGFRDSFQSKNLTEALNTMATGIPADWEQRAKQIVFSEVDQTTGEKKARAGEDVMLEGVVKNTKRYEEFQLKGFDNLVDDANGTKVEKQAFIKNQVEKFIRNNPVLYDAFKDASGNNIDPDFLKVVLHDKAIAAKLSENLAAAYGNGVVNSLNSAETAFIAAEAEWKMARDKVDSAVKEKEHLEKSLTDKTLTNGVAQLEEKFKTEPYNGTTKKDLLDSLKLDTDVAICFEALKTIDDSMKLKDATQDISRKAFYNTTINNAKAALAKKSSDPAIATKFSEAQKLQDEFNEIKATRAAAEARLPEVDKELTVFQNERNQKALAKTQTETSRNALRAQLIRDVETALEQAGNDALVAKVSQRLEGLEEYKQQLEQEKSDKAEAKDNANEETKNKEQTEAEQLLSEDLDIRYIEHYTTMLGRESTRINRRNVEDDFRILTGPEGPRGLLRAALDRTITDPDQIDRLIADPDFVKIQTTRVVGRAMQSYTAAGLPMDRGQMNALALTEWGKTTLPDWTKNIQNHREMVQGGMSTKANSLAELITRHPILGILGLIIFPYTIARARAGRY